MFLSLSSVVSKNSEEVPLGRFKSFVCSERDSWSRAPKREAFSAMALILRAAIRDESYHDDDFGRQVPVADGSVTAAWEKFLTLLFPALISSSFFNNGLLFLPTFSSSFLLITFLCAELQWL